MKTPDQNNTLTSSGSTAHQFPDITQQPSAVHDPASSDRRDLFRPLYHDADACDTSADDHGRDDDAQGKLEQVRQKGYQDGFEAGRQDACQLANNLLEPHVSQFHQNIEQLTAYQNHLADHASAHMLRLAIAIAERVMDDGIQTGVEDLKDMRPTLIAAMCKRHQLRLRYHPRDLADLQQLMLCRGEAQWQSTNGVSIIEDDSVPLGELDTTPNRDERAAIDEQIITHLQTLLNTESA